MSMQKVLLKKAIIFEPDLSEDKLVCRYRIDNQTFINTYEFPAGINIDKVDTETAKQLSRWMAIASSFGLFSVAYLDELVCDFPISSNDVTFFEKVFYLGFGEFKLTNAIPLTTTTTLSSTMGTTPSSPPRDFAAQHTSQTSGRSLLLNGGGKDGSVSASILSRNNIDFSWFQRGNSVAQQQVVQAWDKPLITVKRILDPNRKKGVYSGHRPMSAGIAFLAMLSAYLYDYRYVIASNESSANEGNVTIDGFTVNHQYSKSLEFEMDFQTLFRNAGIHDVSYFSLLRPLNELQIATFTKGLNSAQLAAIVSCNNGTTTGTWCLKCPKCAFIALVIYAVGPNVAAGIWGDIDVINTPTLLPYITELIDPSQDKPLECVGTLDECHIAANLILQNDSRKPFLATQTKETLHRFLPLGTETRIPSSIGPHQLPDEFKSVLTYMQQSLS